MGIVRPAQPSAEPVPGLKVEFYATSTAMPIGISRDRKTIYGSATGSNTILRQSTDDGTTWTTVYTFPYVVNGILETDDGEALAYCQGGTASPGYIYKSTGWSTSHTTATWTLKLTSIAGYFQPRWNGAHSWSFGNDKLRTDTSRIGVAAEYGGQTTASGDQTGKATRVYFTTDFGATWTQILDLQIRFPGIANLHVHTSAYDPYWDRIWILYGDTNPEGSSYLQILYSDDRGATWSPLPLGAGFSYNAGQCTTIAVLSTCIILGGDNAPGYLRVPRKGYRLAGDIQATATFCGGTGTQMLASGIHQNRNQPGAPILAVSQSQSVDTSSPLLISTNDGTDLVQVWEDTTLRGSAKGWRAVFGPTYNGKIVGWVSPNGTDAGSGTHYLIRGELVFPEAGLLDGQQTLTGDGTTTVFNIPHGLPAAPSRYMAWEEKPVGAYTLSVTSTNIVVTFTTAPAAGSYPFQWRAGA